MAKATQDERVMNIRTPLGKDVLLLSSFTAEEEISRLYTITAELLHEGAVGGDVPHEVAPNTILGKAVAIEVLQRDGTKRFFHGIVNRFEQRNRDDRFTHYQAEIVPQVWLLTQIAQSKIFQNQTVPEILNKVFEGLNPSFQLQRTYDKRNYCVQYRETNFEFASRLMEEEGIFYFFEHTDTTHKMIVGDVATVHPDCPNTHEFSFDLDQPSGDDFVPLVREWIVNHRLQTGKVTFWDHNFELPFNRLDATVPSRFPLEGKDKLEVYDYPGGYSRKFDGIDSGGGEQPGELNKVFADKDKAANLSMEAIDSRYKIISGVGECSSMTAGHTFNLVNHPLSSNNGKYVITSISHSATQSPDYASENVVLDPYDNAFNCIPVGAGAPVFRPEHVTPKPLVTGSQTATVMGPAGEEILTDKYGRVKVQFRWDRHGQMDERSSCWIRVAQSWAGKKWGTMFIPRIGMEVLVDFIEGDPDRPIITGCVYNAEAMPPYDLPEHKTRSTIKSNSSKGGNGFNEFRIEDKKGEEQIFIHAEKDLDIRVKNDKKEIVKRDRHVIVERNSFEEGKGDSHNKLSGDSNAEMGGSASFKVGGDVDAKVGGKVAVEAGSEIHLKAGMKVVIEAGTQITLKVGGNFVDIGPAGVTIKGAIVNINSGGAAGSGSGASTTSPTAPEEAVDDKAGQEPGKPPPPSPPSQTGPTAGALAGAAGSGAPTVGTGSGAGGPGGTGGAESSPAGTSSGAGSGDAGAGTYGMGHGGANEGGSLGNPPPGGAGGADAGGSSGAESSPAGANSGGDSGEAGAGTYGMGHGGANEGGSLGSPPPGGAGGADAGGAAGGGTTTENSDGTKITTFPDGTQVDERPDGSKSTYNPDGSQTDEYPDGTKVTTGPGYNSSAAPGDPDGIYTQENPDGTTETRDTASGVGIIRPPKSGGGTGGDGGRAAGDTPPVATSNDSGETWTDGQGRPIAPPPGSDDWFD